jgi:hypothetical protein
MNGKAPLLVGIGLVLIGVMAVMGPKVGAIGVGTFIALVVAVVATAYVIRGRGADEL